MIKSVTNHFAANDLNAFERPVCAINSWFTLTRWASLRHRTGPPQDRVTIRPLQSAREITSVRKERDLHLTVRTIPDGAITLELVWSDPRSDSERAVKGSGRERTMGSLAKCLYADKEENRRRERGI